MKSKVVKNRPVPNCVGCLPVARIEGKVDALLMMKGLDPKKTVKANPGAVNQNYVKLCFKGASAERVFKWFVGILVGIGGVTAIVEVIKFVWGF